MSRNLRVEFADAIYHVTSRGDHRQDIVYDAIDRDHFWHRIEQTVDRFVWRLFAAVVMTNHFHLFFQTPQPNLSMGMQFLLGGYAGWWNHHHRQSGHVFQSRFHADVIQDESYFWNVSRYVHLNPVRSARPPQLYEIELRSLLFLGCSPPLTDTAHPSRSSFPRADFAAMRHFSICPKAAAHDGR